MINKNNSSMSSGPQAAMKSFRGLSGQMDQKISNKKALKKATESVSTLSPFGNMGSPCEEDNCGYLETGNFDTSNSNMKRDTQGFQGDDEKDLVELAGSQDSSDDSFDHHISNEGQVGIPPRQVAEQIKNTQTKPMQQTNNRGVGAAKETVMRTPRHARKSGNGSQISTEPRGNTAKRIKRSLSRATSWSSITDAQRKLVVHRTAFADECRRRAQKWQQNQKESRKREYSPFKFLTGTSGRDLNEATASKNYSTYRRKDFRSQTMDMSCLSQTYLKPGDCDGSVNDGSSIGLSPSPSRNPTLAANKINNQIQSALDQAKSDLSQEKHDQSVKLIELGNKYYQAQRQIKQLKAEVHKYQEYQEVQDQVVLQEREAQKTKETDMKSLITTYSDEVDRLFAQLDVSMEKQKRLQKDLKASNAQNQKLTEEISEMQRSNQITNLEINPRLQSLKTRASFDAGSIITPRSEREWKLTEDLNWQKLLRIDMNALISEDFHGSEELLKLNTQNLDMVTKGNQQNPFGLDLNETTSTQEAPTNPVIFHDKIDPSFRIELNLIISLLKNILLQDSKSSPQDIAQLLRNELNKIWGDTLKANAVSEDLIKLILIRKTVQKLLADLLESKSGRVSTRKEQLLNEMDQIRLFQ